MNVYQKLNQARELFHQQKLKKSGLNKFAGYQYFELGDFIIPAMQIFKEVGLTSIISFGKETADMRIFNTDKPDEVIVIESPMSEAALKGCHPVQNLGAVQTYLRRYLWVAALEIVEHDALDATTGRKGDAPIVTPKATQEMICLKRRKSSCVRWQHLARNWSVTETLLEPTNWFKRRLWSLTNKRGSGHN
jgi:ERF superfamily